MRGIRIAQAVCLIAAFSLRLHAEMTISVQVGADERIRSDTLAPIRVVIVNDDVPRKGTVSVELPTVLGKGPQARVSMALAPMARKSAFLYVPAPTSATSRAIVRYENARGREVARVELPVRPVPVDRPVLGFVGEWPRGLPDEEVKGKPVYARARMSPEQVPDRAEGLDMFDAILISPPLRGPLSGHQNQALRDWVLQGGCLIVEASQRTDALRSDDFAELLPFLPQASQEGRLDLLDAKAHLATGTVRRGARVLTESNGYPLVIEGPMGLGRVVCIAVALDQPAVLQWHGLKKFWTDLLGGAGFVFPADEGEAGEAPVPMPNPAAAPGENVPSRKDALARAVNVEEQTGLRLGAVVLLMLIYAVVAGPGDYLLVKRLGRPWLTWITFPAIVLGFTVAAHFGASAWVGGDLSVRHAEGTMVFVDQGVSVRTDLGQVFVPTTKTYTIASLPGAMPVPLQPELQWEAAFALNHDANTVVERIPIWQRRIYHSRMISTEPEPYALTISSSGTKRTATIMNGSERKLVSGTVLWGDHAWPVGQVGPGALVSIELEADAAVPASSVQGRFGPIIRNAAAPASAHPIGRPYDIGRALKQGAVVFGARRLGNSSSPFTVDGESIGSEGTRYVVLLTYGKEGG